MKTTTVTVIDLMLDPALLGGTFAGPSWRAWRILLAAAMALPLATLPPDDQEAALDALQRITGRTEWPTEPAAELWLVIARRGGKSMIAALVAVYLACFQRYWLAPGEKGVFMIVAPTVRQCRVIKGYIAGLLRSSELLAGEIAGETKDGIELANGLRIEVHTASFKSTRGFTVVGCIIDEGAFLPTDDAAEPDKAIIAAIRPAMATVAGALLMFISSPYSRRGELWRVYQRHFGKNGDPTFVAQADTKTMNPTVSDHVIAAAYEQDDSAARSEYGGAWRSDVEGLFSREAIAECVIQGRRELSPQAVDQDHNTSAPAAARWELPSRQDDNVGVNYVAFVDPSGGSADSMTLAIAHQEGDRAILDAIREVKPPFSPAAVVREFVALLQSYRVSRVTGDRYAGEWPREQFRAHGIHYECSTMNRSELYLALLPLVNSERTELLDNERLVNQLSGLERRTSRAGKDSIDHAPGSHDDLANAAAGALVLAVGESAHQPQIFVLDLDDQEFAGLNAMWRGEW